MIDRRKYFSKDWCILEMGYWDVCCTRWINRSWKWTCLYWKLSLFDLPKAQSHSQRNTIFTQRSELRVSQSYFPLAHAPNSDFAPFLTSPSFHWRLTLHPFYEAQGPLLCDAVCWDSGSWPKNHLSKTIYLSSQFLPIQFGANHPIHITNTDLRNRCWFQGAELGSRMPCCWEAQTLQRRRKVVREEKHSVPEQG